MKSSRATVRRPFYHAEKGSELRLQSFVVLRGSPSLNCAVALLGGQMLDELQRRHDRSSLEVHLWFNSLLMHVERVPLWSRRHVHLTVVLVRVLERERHLVHKIFAI